MKKISFNVELTFSDSIYSDDEYNEITQNVMDALIYQVNSGQGLSPEESEGFTEKISVKPNINSLCVVSLSKRFI